MYYYLYQITNKIDGKIYVGVHQTTDLDDGYMGSGVLIRRAIQKHGIENFEKIILEQFNDPASMFVREAEVVNERFVSDHNTYNLGCGGYGGTIGQNRKPFTGPHTDQAKLAISQSRTGIPRDADTKAKISENSWANTRPAEQRAHASNAGKNRMAGDDTAVQQKKRDLSEAIKKVNNIRRAEGLPHPVLGITRDKVACPHCGKEGAMNTMSRWHFDNCKNKTMV